MKITKAFIINVLFFTIREKKNRKQYIDTSDTISGAEREKSDSFRENEHGVGVVVILQKLAREMGYCDSDKGKVDFWRGLYLHHKSV